MPNNWPARIACLSTETVEVLYALGQQDRIAGISGFTVYPPEARREKPKISGFSSARIERILAVRPDLVLAFSDMQTEIVSACVRAGLDVHVFNQRDIDGIFGMIVTLGRLVGVEARAVALVAELAQTLATAQAVPVGGIRPRVYFEEWDDPLITGIRWVSQLIHIAGGVDVFAEAAMSPAAAGRRVTGAQVLQAQPEVIVASWCGKKFNKQQLLLRAGWQDLPAVRDDLVFEIKSAALLVPGISAITRGLPQLANCVQQWRRRHG
jgi:iron complex transport system substrate-binding protein